MATKLYLQSGNTPVISPTPDAGWTQTGDLVRYTASTVKASTAMTTRSVAGYGSAQEDVLIGQWVSGPLDGGQSITAANVQIVLLASETGTGNNLVVGWAVKIIGNDGTAVQDIIAKRNDGTEVVQTTLTSRTDVTTASTYTTVRGDRIVIEIGLTGNPGGASTHDGSIRIGDVAAADLAYSDGVTTDNNPSVNFATDTLTFNTDLYITVSDSTAVTETAPTVDIITPPAEDRNVNISETAITVSDVPVVELVSNISVSDSTSVSGSAVVSLPEDIVVSESIGTSDTATLQISDLQITTSDSVAVTDVPIVQIETAVADRDISASDSTGVSESSGVSLDDLTITTSDTSAVSDSATSEVPIEITVSDSVSASDTVTLSQNDLAISVSDSTGVSDSVNVALPTAGFFDITTVSDSTGVTESITVSLSDLAIEVSDSIGVSDSASAQFEITGFPVNVSDNVTVEDVPHYLYDEIIVWERLFVVLSDLAISVFDSTAVGESIQVENSVLPLSVSDSTSVTDSTGVTVSDLQVSVSDSTGVSDTVNVTIPTPGVFAVTVSDSTGVTESITVSLDDLAIEVSDNISVSDTVTVSVGIEVSTSDSATASDSITVAISDLQAVTADSITVSESIGRLLESYIEVSDSTSLTDVATVTTGQVSDLAISVSESISVTESVTMTLALAGITVSDTITVTDVATTAIGQLGLIITFAAQLHQGLAFDTGLCQSYETNVSINRALVETVEIEQNFKIASNLKRNIIYRKVKV